MHRKLQRDLSFLMMNRKPSPLGTRFQSTAKKGEPANARHYMWATLHNPFNKMHPGPDLQGHLSYHLEKNPSWLGWGIYRKAFGGEHHYHMGVYNNRGIPKSGFLIRFSIKNHPFWGFSPIFGNTHIKAPKKISYLWGPKTPPWMPRSQGLKSSSISKGQRLKKVGVL